MPNPCIIAKLRGSDRSDITHISMWVTSGVRLAKS